MTSLAPAGSGVSVRAVRLGVAVAVAGFWLAAAQGARREPGYDPGRDHLSALASVGAAVPGWGLVMFGCGVAALVAAAGVARALVPGAPAAPRLLLVAAVAVAAAGLFRVTCLSGAAGCSAGPSVVEQVTVAGRLHAAAVVGYQAAFSLALVALGAGAARVSRRSLAALCWLAAAGTALLVVVPLPWGPGTDQRVWVAAGHVALLALAAWPAGRPSRR